MVSLIQRLKERKLVQWTLAYAAGAWALLQVFGELRDTFSWPPVIVQVITMVLGVGFFAALVLAWYHGEKGQQHVTGPELLMLAALLVITGVAVVWVRGDAGVTGNEVHGAAAEGSNAAAAASSAEPRSIAVLPFENLSSDPENEYFSDGITEDILTNLSKVGALRVTSRTSVMSYKETTKKLREIAGELGVGYIVEGSVRRDGDQVRITAQLIDARTDEHLWAETYDRKLEGIFAIQSEIAEKIAFALHASLSPDEQQRIAARGTESLSAYDYYLKGREYLRSYDPEAGERDLRRAASLFQQALVLDPDYALAYAGIASVAQELRWWAGPVWQDSARVAAERAVALDSTSAEVHSTLALVYATEGKGAEALRAARRAVELNPSHASANAVVGMLLRDRGRLDEALPFAQRALALEPTEGSHYLRVGWIYRRLGELPEAERWFRRMLQVEPGNVDAHAWLVRLYTLGGDLKRAEAEVEAMLAQAQWSRTWRPAAEFELYRGNLDAAERYLRQIAEAEASPEFRAPPVELAYIHWKRGERAEADAVLREAEREIQSMIQEHGWEFRYRTLAQIHAIRGEREQALDALERAIEGGERDHLALTRDPMLESLRGDPRFERMMADLKAQLDAMRARIRR